MRWYWSFGSADHARNILVFSIREVLADVAADAFDLSSGLWGTNAWQKTMWQRGWGVRRSGYSWGQDVQDGL